MYRRIIGISLIILGVVLVLSVKYQTSSKFQQPIVFSERNMLEGIWNTDKKIFIDQSGRTVDASRGNTSTSEGQAYTLLRAVWLDDKSTFDQSWTWTQNNLQHKQNDKLFSWYFSKLADGSYGVDPKIGANNTATDGDTDIAVALIFAYDRWGDKAYLDQAKQIIPDIWKNEVIVIKGKSYLLANNLEKTSDKQKLIINPSYIKPYAYRIFAKYDSNDWLGLTNNSYQTLTDVSAMDLNGIRSDGLPPNWATVDKTTGALAGPDPQKQPTLNTNFSFDAMRVPFNLALDWAWFKDDQAKILLSKFGFLNQQWQQNQAIYTDYTRDGQIAQRQEAPAVYGGTLGYFISTNPDQAAAIYNTKLKVLYSPDKDYWKEDLNYYDDNWAWFGLALYNNFTINLDSI
ncbi:MAG: hypothetical protein JWO40_880 [Candidatus Doudnabacteria bacterium]|nr:hypothetical protein [Candidatus Doudnabacteria bacterium]